MDASRIADARRAKRIPVGMPVTLHYMAQNKEIRHRCVTVDLSSFGVRVQNPGNLAKGQYLRILSDEPSRSPIAGRTIWVLATQPNQSAQAGIEFLDPLHVPA